MELLTRISFVLSTHDVYRPNMVNDFLFSERGLLYQLVRGIRTRVCPGTRELLFSDARYYLTLRWNNEVHLIYELAHARRY